MEGGRDMRCTRFHDDPAELAALYASGAMAPELSAAFEQHLIDGCEECRAQVAQLGGVVAALLGDAPPLAPRPETLQALLDRTQAPPEPPHAHAAAAQVWRDWAGEGDPSALFIRRADEGAWQETGVRGVRARRLFADVQHNRVTMLIQMDPGASYPRHIHNGPEECLVLEGDLRGSDFVLRAGDYQRADVGSRHSDQRTEGGCTLLIVSALNDELF